MLTLAGVPDTVLSPIFVLRVPGVPLFPVSTISGRMPFIQAEVTLTPGKNPAGPCELETSEMALRSLLLVDSTVMGPKSPTAPPNCPSISVLRKRPPTGIVVVKGVPIVAPSFVRAVILIMLATSSRLTTTKSEVNVEVFAEEGTNTLVPAS